MRKLSRWPGFFIARIYRAALKPDGGPVPPELRVLLADQQDLAPYADRPGYQMSSAFLEEAWARDDACVATYYQGQLAAYGWVAYHKAPHVDGLWVLFGPGHRYNYKNLTLPQFRGRHLRGSYGVLAQRDQREGVTHSIAFIATHNYASIRAERRNGGRNVGFAGYLKFAGRAVTFSSPGASRYGFSFAREGQRQS
jgi:hypothetical protein